MHVIEMQDHSFNHLIGPFDDIQAAIRWLEEKGFEDASGASYFFRRRDQKTIVMKDHYDSTAEIRPLEPAPSFRLLSEHS